METFDGLRKLPALRPHLQGEEYVEWEGLRKSDESQFLALALPSFLLRRPRGDSPSAEDGDFRLTEGKGLFGCGALAVGAVAAQSFAETGWPTHLTDHTLGGLPVQSGSTGASPLSALLPGSMQSELARAGFTVLSGESNRNTLHVAQSPSVHEPGTYDEPSAAAEARAEASLPCRLFAARTAHRLLEVEESLDASRPIDALRQEVASAMASFLGVPVPEIVDEEEADVEVGEQPISVEHVTDADLPNQEVLGVRIRPPDDLLSPNVRLAMVLRLPS